MSRDQMDPPSAKERLTLGEVAKRIGWVALVAVAALVLPFSVEYIAAHLPSWDTAWRVGAGVAVAVATVGLREMRKRVRIQYGVLEVYLGGYTAWRALSATNPEVETTTLALFGAVYVIIRGLTNVDEGRAVNATKAVEHVRDLTDRLARKDPAEMTEEDLTNFIASADVIDLRVLLMEMKQAGAQLDNANQAVIVAKLGRVQNELARRRDSRGP